MSDRTLSRRHLLTLLGVGAGATALAGCTVPTLGNGGDGGNASGNIRADLKQAALGDVPAQYAGRTNILFWAPWTGELYDVLAKAFTMFNDSQSDIYASLESVGSYADLNTKFTAALQAKAVPDLVCFPELQWLQFYFAGALTPLDPYFTGDWNLDKYLQNYVGEGKAGDATYAVPFARSTPLFYYNRTAFSKLGLPIDTEYTWSQLREFGPQIASTSSSGRPVKTFAYSAADSWYASSWLWAFGGDWGKGLAVIPDETSVSNLMTFVKDWVHVDGHAYQAQAGHTDFQTGLVTAVHGSTAVMRGLTNAVDFDLGAAFMPGEQNQPPKVPTGGSGFSLVKTDSQVRQDASAELLKFLGTPKMSGWYHINSGYVPIVTAARDEPEVKELHASNPNFTVAIRQLENAQTVAPVNWFHAGTSSLAQAFATISGDNAAVQNTIDALRREYESVIDNNRDDLETLGVS